jgi:hypothetical protein
MAEGFVNTRTHARDIGGSWVAQQQMAMLSTSNGSG